MSIPGLNFTAIDFEAANSDRASACAVGLATVTNGEVTSTGAWLIRPHTGLDSFDPYAAKFHGISPDLVADAPSLEESMSILRNLIGDGPLLAHNMSYDGDVLRRSYEIAGFPAPTNEMRCTQTLSRTALKLSKTRLYLVAEHLGLPTFQQHDAGADALTCARVALAIAQREGATTITGLYRGLGIA
jgi:DNA polymerase III subunit epsilon